MEKHRIYGLNNEDKIISYLNGKNGGHVSIENQ